MDIKTLDELREPDERTQRFTPNGLGIGVMLTPESAARFQQEVIATSVLAPNVAEGTRQSFERLRTILAYGVLCYEIFTLVHDHALLVIEQALRDRFIDYHNGVVTFIDAAGATHAVTAARYDDIHAFLSKHKKARLRVGSGPETIAFNGMLFGLRSWARRVGLLRGQRNRRTEQALSKLRDLVAHPNSYHLLTPVDAARGLSDLAEIINHLWGHSTPGGRLYPAPIRREILALAWNGNGGQCGVGPARQLADDDGAGDEWQYAVIRAVFSFDDRFVDSELHWFHSRYEVTKYPSEWLWGPGSRAGATAWLHANRPDPDDCDYIDRVFAIRYDGAQLYRPMRPDVAAVLPESDRTGTWHIVRADYPDDAFLHVRNRVTGVGCQGNGPCDHCNAELLRVGTYDSVGDLIGLYRKDPTYSLEPAMATPFAGPCSYTVK